MTTIRPFTAAAITAGVGYIAEGVVAIIHPVGDKNWGPFADALNIAFLVAVVASAITLPYIGRWLTVHRTARAAVAAAQLGFVAMAVETVVSVAHGGNTLDAVFFIGLLLATLGTLLLAIGGALAGPHRWVASLPLLGWLISIAGGDHGGSIVLGLMFLAATIAVGGHLPAMSTHWAPSGSAIR